MKRLMSKCPGDTQPPSDLKKTSPPLHPFLLLPLHFFPSPTHSTTMDPKLKPAILIVSDTASQDPASDRTVSALSPILEEGKWDPPAIRIVPDKVVHIQQAVCDWTDGPDWYNLILLSGGTGFAVKDNTPEVRAFSFLVLTQPALMTSPPGCLSPDPSPRSGSSVSAHEKLSVPKRLIPPDMG